MRQTLLLLWLTLAACTNAVPCRSCPPVDGVYAVSWGDAGVNASDAGAGCPATGPRVPTWTLAQTDTSVTATIAGASLGGTIYDSYDLVLSGSADSTSTYHLHALAIPLGTGADAGIKLQGTFTTRTLPSSGTPCELQEAFTAQRTSR